MVYVTLQAQLLVFFIEIKTHPALNHISGHEGADRQIQDHFQDISRTFGDQIHLPEELIGLSAMGTQFAT